MSINKEREGSGSDLDRSSWEGMGRPEIDSEVATFIFAVKKKFLDNSNILDLEDAAIELVALLDDGGRDSAIRALIEIKNIGIRGCLEKLVSNDELLKIDQEETKRLIDFLQYAGSTPG